MKEIFILASMSSSISGRTPTCTNPFASFLATPIYCIIIPLDAFNCGEKNIESLTENLSQNNLAKTKALANILALDNTIEDNIDSS